jgi:hypothetical protein
VGDGAMWPRMDGWMDICDRWDEVGLWIAQKVLGLAVRSDNVLLIMIWENTWAAESQFRGWAYSVCGFPKGVLLMSLIVCSPVTYCCACRAEELWFNEFK